MKKFNLVFLLTLSSIYFIVAQADSVTLASVEKKIFIAAPYPHPTKYMYTNINSKGVDLISETPKWTVKGIMPVFLHNAFSDLLKKYVSDKGVVNYKGFKTEKANLEAYIKTLSDNVPASEWSKEEKLAFWINAYNALTIKLILDNYPLSKITNLDGGKTWDVKRFKLGDKTYSLNDIENNIVRPMGDPRIHFALNCAAKSCPPLLNMAFESSNLNVLLEARTKLFINDVNANSISGNEIKISKIFDWYGKDFGASLVEFINKYALKKVKKEVKVGFKEYDWRLNE